MTIAYSMLSTLCLLLLVTCDGGTTMQLHFDNVINSKDSTTAFLDSTSTTTNANDVEGLITLIKRFPALSGDEFPDVSSDPCYPLKLSWIECSNVNDDVRRVTALFLGAQNLFGYLPDFSSMDALQIIYLNDNSLIGPIPEFLGTFPELTFLDLSNNLFQRALPASLANNEKIKLNLAGNWWRLAPTAAILFSSPSQPPPSVEYIPEIPRKNPRINPSRVPRILKPRIVIPTSVTSFIVAICCCRCCRTREDDESIEMKSTTTPPTAESETTVLVSSSNSDAHVATAVEVSSNPSQ